MRLPRVILASASPRRSELLRQLGVQFEVVPGQAEESHPEYLTASEVCRINAHRKARATAKKYPDALVIGADTVVCLDGKIYGKPADIADAERMLLELQGHTHEVVTGVCLVELDRRWQQLFAVTTRVTFRTLTLAQIRDYFSKMNPLDKAGAYGIQEQGDLIVESINGSFSNVVGLPMERLQEVLESWPQGE